jgi:hypothetical protein
MEFRKSYSAGITREGLPSLRTTVPVLIKYQFVYDQMEKQRDGGARVASSTEMTLGRKKEISKRHAVSALTGRIGEELHTVAEG